MPVPYRFHIILENIGGKIDERFARDEAELQTAVLAIVKTIVFRAGDVIRIVDVIENQNGEG